MKVKVSKLKIVLLSIIMIALCSLVVLSVSFPSLFEEVHNEHSYHHANPFEQLSQILFYSFQVIIYPLACITIAFLVSMMINISYSSNSYAYKSNGYLIYPTFLSKIPLTIKLSEISSITYDPKQVKIVREGGQELLLSSTAFGDTEKLRGLIESVKADINKHYSLYLNKSSIKTREALQKAITIAERSFSIGKEKFLSEFKKGDVLLTKGIAKEKADEISERISKIGLQTYSKERINRSSLIGNFGYSIPSLVYLSGTYNVPGFFLAWVFYINYRLQGWGAKKLGLGFIILAMVAETIQQVGNMESSDNSSVLVILFLLDYMISIILSLQILKNLEGTGIKYSKPLAVLLGSVYANYKINRLGNDEFRRATES
ncbi:hypothetical protein PVT67_00615 [Gallaecimonas kandeliae]|uniref:hypothetical protein n=1 Tax=Gallaecimonas kandeliae TaxID=3029055 RepID=UPI002647988F|nr:hypothetical protein [Gallaecimonas kandeliae]WKE65792.1 hypothetical protein PVT67_00615 [Gallaecimonas kandeliae]